MLCVINTQYKMQTLRRFRHLTPLQLLGSICGNLTAKYLMSIWYLHILGEESGQKSPISRSIHHRSWILFYWEGAIWLGFITDSHIQSHQHHFSNTISYKWMLLTFPTVKAQHVIFIHQRKLNKSTSTLQLHAKLAPSSWNEISKANTLANCEIC